MDLFTEENKADLKTLPCSPGHYVKQQYLSKKVCYYEPTDLGHEAKIKERLEKLRRKG